MKTNNEDQHFTSIEKRMVLEWSAAPAPGEKGVAGYKPPRLQIRRKVRVRRWLYNAAAALLLFTLGYFAGAGRNAALPEPRADTGGAATPLPAIIVSARPVEPVVNQPPSSAPQENVDCPSPQVYQGSDGHFRINTTLCESGSRATWVINPKLELASAPEPQREEKQ